MCAVFVLIQCNAVKPTFECPSGSEHYGTPPPAGKRVFCGKTGGIGSEAIRHGPWRSYWPNGKLESSRHYKEDVEDGEYRTFRVTGAKILEGSYKDGLKVGTWKKYGPDGNLLRETEYAGGKKAVMKLYDKNGNFESELVKQGGEWVTRRRR